MSPQRLEFLQIAVVDQPQQHFAVVGRMPVVGADNAVDLARVMARRQRRSHIPALLGHGAEVGRDAAHDGDRMAVVLGQMVGDAADAAVHLAAAQGFNVNLFLGGGIHQFGPGEEHRALIAHNHRLVAQRRQIGAAGGGRPMHGRDLGDALGRHADLVVENGAELAIVGKYMRLLRQVGAARLHHGDAGQPVLPGEHLGPHMLFGSDAVVGAALDRGIVDHQHAGAPAYQPDAGDDAAARWHARVQAVAGELPELEEGRAGVEHGGQALARQQLLALLVQQARLFGAADQGTRAAFMQVANACLIGLAVALELGRVRRGGGCHQAHRRGFR